MARLQNVQSVLDSSSSLLLFFINWILLNGDQQHGITLNNRARFAFEFEKKIFFNYNLQLDETTNAVARDDWMVWIYRGLRRAFDQYVFPFSPTRFCARLNIIQLPLLLLLHETLGPTSLFYSIEEKKSVVESQQHFKFKLICFVFKFPASSSPPDCCCFVSETMNSTSIFNIRVHLKTKSRALLRD